MNQDGDVVHRIDARGARMVVVRGSFDDGSYYMAEDSTGKRWLASEGVVVGDVSLPLLLPLRGGIVDEVRRDYVSAAVVVVEQFDALLHILYGK